MIRLFTAFGETKNLSEWSRDNRCQISPRAIVKRLNSGKYTAEECIVLDPPNGPKMIKIGTRFGKLVVIEYAGKNNNQKLLWKCECDCGKIKIILGTSLRRKRGSQSCGCNNVGGGGNILPMGESSFNRLFERYQIGALRRNLIFNLSKDLFRVIISKKCFYCGRLPEQEYRAPYSKGSYIYNGIDRINNNLGYFEENCVPCCKWCNWMKSDQDIVTFLNKVNKIFKNLNL